MSCIRHEWVAFARIDLRIFDLDTLAGSFSVKSGYLFRKRSTRGVPDLMDSSPSGVGGAVEMTASGV
jgi:hypothetical protein